MHFDDPEFGKLLEMVQGQKAGLLAKETREEFKDPLAGTSQFASEREQGAPGFRPKTGLTSAEFATRAEAEAAAQERGRLDEERKAGAGSFKRTTQVVEDEDAQGNKVYRVIDTSPGAIGSRITTNAPSQPTTDVMRQSYDYASRAAAAHARMLQLEPALMQRPFVDSLVQMNKPESITDPVVQQYIQLSREYINAQARRESGAAISQAEYDNYGRMVGFKTGDDPQTLAQKQDSRRRVITGLAQQSGDRLSRVFVTEAEVHRDAQERGVPVEQALREAEAEGLKVIR